MASAVVRAGVLPATHDAGGVPDVPIEYSVPYRSREAGASRHFGFLPFFAKKPWPVVQEYIKHYSRAGEFVCDPFAGSGVTLVESLVLGRRAVGSDINPVARFITRATAVAPVDLEGLRAAHEHIRALAQKRIEALDTMVEEAVVELLQALDYPRAPIPSTVRRGGANTVDQLHTPRQLAGLTILRDAIRTVEDAALRDLLRVALAGTVRYANITYILPFEKGRQRSPYRGDAGFLRRFSYSPASKARFYEHRVWPAFEMRFEAVVDAKEETNRLIGERYNPEGFTLAAVPASRIHEVAGEATVDYCFTDPPYSNEIHFLDLSTLWAAWLDLEITDEERVVELIVGGTQRKSREQFEREFAASMESIARALKPDRWFTLVYKHRDLSLWQTIIAVCEASGLHYVNAVWQDVKIRSTRQIESPNINPPGDMYLNFRRMSQTRFEAFYGRGAVLDIPTRSNYAEHEVERLIVAYLGADIELIASGVIQQVLDSRAFRNYREDPRGVSEDLRNVLRGPRFDRWSPPGGGMVYVMAPSTRLDSSLDLRDRARYHVFDVLRQRVEATESEINEELLTRLAQEHSDQRPRRLDVRALLRTVAQDLGHHRWRFEPNKVAEYKQLRLFFERSRADELREWIERHETRRMERSRGGAVSAAPRLQPDLEGLTLLHERLREANRQNPRFKSQYRRLMEVLQTVRWRLESEFADQIERVMAAGEWVEGVDLRALSCTDVVLEMVVRSTERPFQLYWEIADRVFADLDDADALIQFRIVTLPEWQQAQSLTPADEQEASGIPLLVRA